MPGRRATLRKDRQRNSVASKRTRRKAITEQQEQAELLRQLEARLRAEARA